jgi:hypothetical protein
VARSQGVPDIIKINAILKIMGCHTPKKYSEKSKISQF